MIIYSIPTLTMNIIKTHWINSCKPRWLHYNRCKISWVTKDLHYKYTRTLFLLQSSSCKMYLYLAIKNSHKMSTFVQIFKIEHMVQKTWLKSHCVITSQSNTFWTLAARAAQSKITYTGLEFFSLPHTPNYTRNVLLLS